MSARMKVEEMVEETVVWKHGKQVCVLVGELADGTKVEELRDAATGRVLEVMKIRPFDLDGFWQAAADEHELKTGKKVDHKELQARARAHAEKRKTRRNK